MKSFLRSAALLGAIFSFPLLLAQEEIYTEDLSQNRSDRGVAFQEPALSSGGEIRSAVGAGDVDGDGFGDLLFMLRDPCDSDHFVSMVLFGRAGMAGLVDIKCTLPRIGIFRSGSKPGDIPFPGNPSPAGDVNGDGLSDFFISVSHRNGESHTFLIYGSENLEGAHFVEDVGAAIPGVKFWSSDPQDQVIGSAAGIGDFDGDGRADIALGAPYCAQDGISHVGKIFIIFDAARLDIKVDVSQVGAAIRGIRITGAQFPASEPDFEGPVIGEAVGFRLSEVGDVDGDGRNDLLMKALGEGTIRRTNMGRNYLIRGASSYPPVIDLMETVTGGVIPGVSVIRGPNLGGGGPGGVGDGEAQYFSGDGIGDLNGDGYADLFFGSPQQANLFFPPDSSAYILYGGPDWPPLIEVAKVPTRVKVFEFEKNADFAFSVARGNDLNGDQVPDLLVGAPHLNFYQGEAYAIYGSRKFDPNVHLADGFEGIRVISEYERCVLGQQVAPAGDFNGDGGQDFLVTSVLSIPDQTTDGAWCRVYLIYGLGGKPQPLRLQGIKPAWGPVRGGTTVELRGAGFQGEPKVYFGKSPADLVHVLSPNRISARTPPGEAPGFVDVALAIGTEVRRLDFGYEYTPNFPEIDLDQLGSSGLLVQGEFKDLLGSRGRIDIGDITGDGIDDLITASDKIAVIKGARDLPEEFSAITPSERVSVIHMPETAGVYLWTSIVGDVNGDGILDLGIQQSDALGYILFGRRDLPPRIDIDTAIDAGQAVRVIPGGPAHIFSMARLGDLTGDGIEDFAVGLSDDAGVIILVKGQRTWPSNIDLGNSPLVFARIHGSRPGQGLSLYPHTAGDVNGDGFLDLLAAAGRDSGDLFSDPLALVIYVRNDFPPDVDVEGYVRGGGGLSIKLTRGNFNLAAPGDVNGDHYADILIGMYQGGTNDQGESHLIFGGEKLPRSMEPFENPQAQDEVVRILGESSPFGTGMVGAAGDFNNDGFQDFLIGDSLELDPTDKSGNVFLILGQKQLPSPIELAHLGSLGIQIRHPEFGGIGQKLGPFGDLNGDGQTDFCIGAGPRIDDQGNSLDQSRLYVIYGPYGQKEFIRGDANRDGLIDIADPITILAYLFQGGERPLCIDALDTDDSGLLDITDAVNLLTYHFQAGPAPAEPFPAPGKDPTRDVLDCLGFNP